MDAIDRKILAVLQDDASLSVAEIGNRVGLSSTPCWKRIQRLETDGVIQKRVAIVDQDRIGLGISVFVSVETGDHSQDWLDRFAKTVTAMPEVMEFYRMAGDVDYMLRVVVPDIAKRLRLVLQAIDCLRAAEECDVAICDGEDQVDDGAPDPAGLNSLGRGALDRRRLPRTHVHLVVLADVVRQHVPERRVIAVHTSARIRYVFGTARPGGMVTV